LGGGDTGFHFLHFVTFGGHRSPIRFASQP
jgi:hypothetical protein